MANQDAGWRKILNATRYSWQGLKAAWQYEAAFRQESVLALLAIVAALFSPVTLLAKLLLILSVMLIIIVELINSAIEAVVDRLGDERHPLAGRAKDMGSAAVFISILLAVMIWAGILCSLIPGIFGHQ